MDLLCSNLYKSDIHKVIDDVDCNFFKNSTVLVTGGLGLICSTIIDLLIEIKLRNNVELNIYIADRNKELFEKKYIKYDFVHYLEYDASLPINFSGKFDYIIHGAGIASPEKYISMPVETMLTTINGTINLLDYCKSNNVKRYIYISSSEVYGIKNSLNRFLESDYGFVDVDDVRSSYPISKRTAELLCHSYSSEYDIDTVIVRPGHVYGPSASIHDNRVSSVFAYRAAQGLDLNLKSSGLQKRSYIYSVDCAFAILCVLIHGKKDESYNIGTEYETTIREMAEYYAKIGCVDLTVLNPSNEERKAFNPMDNATLDIKKIKDIGYKDHFSAKEGFFHTVEIIKETAEY